MSYIIPVSCALARAVNRARLPGVRQVLQPGVARVFSHLALFLFTLLLLGMGTAFALWQLSDPGILPGAVHARSGHGFIFSGDLLSTQIRLIGGTLLLWKLLFASFVIPLYLFHEFPLATCWRLSFLAMQLNPWLWPILGLFATFAIVLSMVDRLSILAQIIALPLPVYLGVLMYVAWTEIFQDGLAQDARHGEVSIDEI